ncbi:MAG: putative phosphoglycerate mutase [Parcubacteria group bacterium Licking1014_1]|nr:MAG: putative phosphoglycerate mutase [Parcubacteria group bacterium Licking1014_1]
MILNNKYYILRHGEALSNVKNIVSCWPEKFKNPLTKKGVGQIKSAAEELKNKSMDLIFTSPLLRTKQTAEIAGKRLKIKPKTDKRLREVSFGLFNGKPVSDFLGYFKNDSERADKATPKGENYKDVFERVFGFFEKINRNYKDKNILIISHQVPLFLLEGYVRGLTIAETIENFPDEKMLRKGEIRELN